MSDKNNRCKKIVYSETSSLSQKDYRDLSSTKSPVIISQYSGGYIDSIHDDCLTTVLELNDGQPKIDHSTESSTNSTMLNERPKKFRINIVKPKKDLEIRKTQLLEEKEMFELRLKRFPGYMLYSTSSINQGDYELPTNGKLNDSSMRIRKSSSSNYSTSKIKQMIELKLSKKHKYSTSPEEALKFYDSITEIKIQNEDDFDKDLRNIFPLGSFVVKSKTHVHIIYIPECEIMRKLMIGYYGLNAKTYTIEEFEEWCQKNNMYNSKSMYETYFDSDNNSHGSIGLLKSMMKKYHVGIILSDFFRYRNCAAYRALVIFSDSVNNIKLCINDFKNKLPVNILPYLHENPDDESSLAPIDFEEIDYFRRNYHRLLLSENVIF